MNKLFILDGMALAYRAYFAFISSPVRTSKGVNTSALFGFANTLLTILQHEKPTHLAACFDTSAPTERHRLYPAYKATRDAMPEDLRTQIPLILNLLESMNIPVLRYDGYEADDTIGTLTTLATQHGGYQSYMVSLDKDLGQLINPATFMWRPGKRGIEHEVIDAAKLCEDWGISTPAQLIDILALMGDSSDNVPGVPGIGEKTARLLIAEYQSVEILLENASKIKGKRGEVLQANSDLARLCKRLVTINCQVPLHVSLADLAVRSANDDALQAILAEYELHSIRSRYYGKSVAVKTAAKPAPPLPIDDLFAPKVEPSTALDARDTSSVPEKTKTPFFTDASGQPSLFDLPAIKSINDIKHSYHTVVAERERQALAQRLLNAPAWCFDTETTGLDVHNDTLLGIAFALSPHEAYFVPIRDPSHLEPFLAAFHSNAEKIGHNLKFDLQVLLHCGVEVRGPFFDTMLAHCLLHPTLKHGMDALAESMLSYKPIEFEEILPPIDKASPTPMAERIRAVPVDVLARYAAEDADVTLQLAQRLKKEIAASGMKKLFYEIETPLLPVLAQMEFEGVRVLPSVLHDVSDSIVETIEELRVQVETTAGHPINLNSPKQMGDFLFDELKLVDKPKRTKTGQFVTDEETLALLQHKHPVIPQILSYRELAKLKSTYLDALPRAINPATRRIHTSFLQLVTATGRLASQDPNLQNIPVRTEQGRLIRKAFVPRDEHHVFLSADYSQIELRIMAALSNDPALVSAFKAGRDIHTETASLMYAVPREDVTREMRRAAKMVNFGIIYGISAFGLSQRLGCPRAEATRLIESYFKQFPGVKIYMDSLIQSCRQKGYAETLCGRRRLLPDINSANKTIAAAAERTAINTPIQGTAAEMIKIAMLRVNDLLQHTKSRLILQIHDELIVDLHRDDLTLIPKIEQAMMNALPLPNGVPIMVEAGVGPTWLDAH